MATTGHKEVLGGSCPEIVFHDGAPEERRRCPICLVVFSTRGTMKRHMDLHSPHDAPKYCCDICLKRFSRKHYAKVHRINVHGLHDDG